MQQVIATLAGLALVAATVSAVLHLMDVGSTESAWRPIGEIVLLSGVWLLANSVFEGKTLWQPTYAHGVTVADLLVIPALGVALVLFVQKLA